MIDLKVVYQSFYNQWQKNRIMNRNILSTYVFIDERFISIYILSFSGLTTFNKVSKFLGKNI